MSTNPFMGNRQPRILFSWIGHADLRAMAAAQPNADQDRIMGLIGGVPSPKNRTGPIQTMLRAEAFDEIHLLSNYPAWVNGKIREWIGAGVTVHSVNVDDPTDYEAIFRAADQTLRKTLDRRAAGRPDVSILLSPGTPAMAAIWVLLGKSRYPARFYQTFSDRATLTSIPFDLAVDFIPEVLRDADSLLSDVANRSPRDVPGFERIIGNSSAIRLAVARARKAALRDVSVLLLGESGTGKELFARAIHAASRRSARPFVALNCAALPRDLLESALFGHKRGAFTGAVSDHAGAFEEADGGILFLDEVGECPPDIQAKLLRVLQPVPGALTTVRTYRRIGEAKDRTADVRVLAATNRSLPDEVAQGRFRADLYYRLAVITVSLPSLRQRRPDLKELAAALLSQINEEFARQEPGYEHKNLSASAIAFVNRHRWPGNVRQLHNTLMQAAVMADGTQLSARDLESAVADSLPSEASGSEDTRLGDGFSLTKHLESLQLHFLQRAMREAKGVKTHAARLLGMANYQTLDAQLKRFKVVYRKEPDSM